MRGRQTGPIENFKDLLVWQKSMDLVEAVYLLSSKLPREETFGLTAQMRRAAVSIPSNIAEGQQRRGPREFLHFLSIAIGSLAEIETQLLLTVRLNYLTQSDVRAAFELVHECQRMVQTIRIKLTGRL
jgi:four helix bundle protein